MTRRLILLDRDGVINEDSDSFITNPESWHPIPGSLEAIARLNRHGFLPVVISNQSGVGRGLLTLDDLNAIHSKMHQFLSRRGATVEAVLFCPHAPSANCSCRKPRTGLLELAARRFSHSLNGVIAVGDSWRDLVAARSVGAQGVLVRTGKGMRTLSEHSDTGALFPVFVDLCAVVDALLTKGRVGK